MPSRYIKTGGSFVELDGGGGGSPNPSDFWPSPPTATDSVNTATSARGVITLTGDSTSHTWGSYSELSASLSEDVEGIQIYIPTELRMNATNTAILLQFATGASSSETEWATIAVGHSAAGNRIDIPGFIATGTRVSARLQGAVSSDTCAFNYGFIKKRTPGIGAPITYGADTATSAGIVLTNPGSTNTKSAWTEITASTAANICALAITPTPSSATSLVSGGLLLDVGVGSSGNEQVVIPNLYFTYNSNVSVLWRLPLTYGVNIPAGSRIAVRWQRTSGSNPCSVVLVCATAT